MYKSEVWSPRFLLDMEIPSLLLVEWLIGVNQVHSLCPACCLNWEGNLVENRSFDCNVVNRLIVTPLLFHFHYLNIYIFKKILIVWICYLKCPIFLLFFFSYFVHFLKTLFYYCSKNNSLIFFKTKICLQTYNILNFFFMFSNIS